MNSTFNNKNSHVSVNLEKLKELTREWVRDDDDDDDIMQLSLDIAKAAS